MKSLKLFFLFLIIVHGSIVFAANKSGEICLTTSKFVLFSKGLRSIKSQQHSNPTLAVATLCPENMMISVDQFVKVLKQNCVNKDNLEEVDFYTREIASDLSQENAVSALDSLQKVSSTAIKTLRKSINDFSRCNNKKTYTRMISEINLDSDPRTICYDIISIMNQARLDKDNCTTKH